MHACICVYATPITVGCYWWFHFTLPTGEVMSVQSTHGGEELSCFLPVDSWSSNKTEDCIKTGQKYYF